MPGEMTNLPAVTWDAITPADSDLGKFYRAIYVGGAGDLALRDENDNDVTFVGVPAGTMLAVSPRQVRSTNTTATNIVGLD